MQRLMLSAVVARHYLSGQHPYGWPSFVAIGGTAEGKATLARFTCRALGLSEKQAIRLMRTETPGSLFARRRQQPGGGWTVERPLLLDLPFACLDELDKVDAGQARAALMLLQGDAEADLEGTPCPSSRPCSSCSTPARPGSAPYRTPTSGGVLTAVLGVSVRPGRLAPCVLVADQEAGASES